MSVLHSDVVLIVNPQPFTILVPVTGQRSKEEYWRALLKGWEPYHMGWKKPWWQSVACPDDVDNEQEFRQGTCMPDFVAALVCMHGVPGSRTR